MGIKVNFIGLFSYVKSLFVNTTSGVCVKYSVRHSVQYSVHCSGQCSVQCSVQYGVHFTVSYNLQEAGMGLFIRE